MLNFGLSLVNEPASLHLKMETRTLPSSTDSAPTAGKRTEYTSLPTKVPHIQTTPAWMKPPSRHFDALIGTGETRNAALELPQLITPSEHLADLDDSFSEEEIWKAVKHLHAHKAPGPDGFSAEFLRACWDTKEDFLQAFALLHEARGRRFQPAKSSPANPAPEAP
jgi:hypothetical protein